MEGDGRDIFQDSVSISTPILKG